MNDHESLEPVEEVPQISNAKSNVDAVKQLLTSGWAHIPRTLKEVVDALRTSGLYVQSTDISGILTNLVRKGEISRTRTDRGYGYYLAFAKVGKGVRLMGPTEKPRDSDEE
jgi:predicted transcriptional regulator